MVRIRRRLLTWFRIQEETVSEVSRAEEGAYGLMDTVGKFFLARSKLVERVRVRADRAVLTSGSCASTPTLRMCSDRCRSCECFLGGARW